LNIKAAYLDDPVIHIYHKARAYNKEANKKNDSLTLYQRLMGEMEEIVSRFYHYKTWNSGDP
jgi:hypothetical protein